MPVRRTLQSQNNMSLSNINGWFSNMRRRCGWNALLADMAGGDKATLRGIIKDCLTGKQSSMEVKKRVGDMIDYILGRARGEVGEWLLQVSWQLSSSVATSY